MRSHLSVNPTYINIYHTRFFLEWWIMWVGLGCFTEMKAMVRAQKRLTRDHYFSGVKTGFAKRNKSRPSSSFCVCNNLPKNTPLSEEKNGTCLVVAAIDILLVVPHHDYHVFSIFFSTRNLLSHPPHFVFRCQVQYLNAYLWSCLVQTCLLL